MSITGIIRGLADKDIKLWLDGDVLRYDAPAGGLDPETRATIVGRKAEIVEFLRSAAGNDDHTALPRRPADARIPLSVGQERLWFLFKLEGPSSVYNVVSSVTLGHTLTPAEFRAMLATVVARHESLRTRFAEDAQGVPYSVIEPEIPLAVSLIDLSAVADPERLDAEIRRLVVAEETRLFDLARGPLLAGSLIRLPNGGTVLLLNIHHIAVDAWSMGLIGRELAELIRARREHATPRLAPVDYQYADFAWWQAQQVANGEFARQLDYWQQQLQGLQPLLEMPTDFPRPERQRFRGFTEKMLLPAGLADAMQTLCRSRGATLFMGLLAAFDILVARYAGREDIVVGSALSGRTHPDTHSAVGMFTNTVALRNRVDGRRGFLALLDEVRATTLAAQAHQDVPFRHVVEKTVGKRSLSHTPLYQVSFALNNAAEQVVNDLIAENALQYSDNDGVQSTTVKDDLSLQARILPDQLELKLSYDAALFSRATALRMLEHYRNLLQAILAAPELPVASLPMIDARERAWLLERGQAPMPGYPSNAGLHELVAELCREAPDRIAVQHDGFQLSYAALDRWSDGLAAQLRAAGAGLGDRIGLSLTGTPELVAGILAILKIGACYVPLDRAYPGPVVAQMIVDAGLRLVVTDGDEANWHGATAIACDRRRPAQVAGSVMPVAGGADLPAYVNYTSGSTGTPKGVEVNHRNVVRLVRGTNYVQFGPDDVFVQMSNHSFDAFTFEVWGALLNGGRLVHLEREQLLEPAHFGAFLRDSKVSAMFVTAALFANIVRLAPNALASVHNVLVGGDVVSVDALVRIEAHGRPKRLVNGYGPTENTTFSTAFEYTDPAQFQRSMIGTPIGNSTARVLDGELNLVPIGVAGELYVGGDGVAIGYVGRPDQTAERFLPDPFGATPGARMYRTGDRVRIDADGQLEFLGRLDNQVKIRGFRIETGEIEVRLSAHPDVRQAAVLVDVGADGDKRLVAYLALDGDDDGALDRVRRHVKETLPEYKHPSAWIVLEQLPMNQNGKLDRARLPASAHQSERRVEAPRDDMERVVAEVWRELLGRDDISVDDSFFELGGHSLLAITASVRFKDRLGAEVGTRDIFEHPVLADLAAFLRERPRSQVSALPPLTAASRRERAVPSFAQQRLWFVEQIEGASAVYHMPLVLRLDRRFEQAVVEAALQTLQQRHDALRTAFSEVNGLPRAVLATALDVPLRIVDLGRVSADPRAIEQRCEKLIGEELETPFDLSAAPLYRALLLRLPDGGHVLAITLHHVICDGWSLGILQRELARLLDDPHTALPPLEFQYGDYAHWYRSWLESGALKPHIEHWRQRLQGMPELLSLRPGEPRPDERRQQGRTIEARFDEPLVAGLEALANRHGCTLFMAMLAGFQILLARHSGQSDIVVGTPAANRPLSALESMVGLFVNMLPLRTQIEPGLCFGKLLGRVRETTLDAYEHQGVPFEQLVDALGLARNLSHAPLVQVVFAQENFVDAGEQADGIEPLPLRSHNRTAKFDLNVAFERLPDGARLYFEYDVDLYSFGFVRGLIDEYRSVLADCLAAPDAGIARHLSAPAPGAVAEVAVVEQAAPTTAEAPRAGTEQLIAEIWSGLLDGQPVMRDDNFFALGGHSLLASQACAAINERLGTELRIRAFYACKSLAALAEAIDAERRIEQQLDAVDLDALTEEEAERMLSALQAGGALT